MRRTLAVAGLLSGLFWMALAFVPSQMQETRADEIFWNRLWTPALLGMLLGNFGFFQTVQPSLTKAARFSFIAMLVGFGAMILGNFAEYWLLSDLPHQGPDGYLRGIAWMTFLSGMLLMLIASAGVGSTMPRTPLSPRWLKLLFVLLFPLTIAAGFVNMHWAGMPLGILGAIVGGFGLLSAAGDQRKAGDT